MQSRPCFQPRAAAFSMVEVTLALGLLAFCLIPLIGLLPTGLNAQQSAVQRARATDALSMLATGVKSSQFVSRDSTGAATYQLPAYLSDTGTAKTFTAGGGVSTYAYGILDDGSIRKSTDTALARQTMFVSTLPPSTDAQLRTSGTPTPSSAVRVYALVAWPALPSDKSDMKLVDLKNRQGFLESYITYVPAN